MEMVSKALRNWKIHALALVILVAAEKIGNIAFSIGPAKVISSADSSFLFPTSTFARWNDRVSIGPAGITPYCW